MCLSPITIKNKKYRLDLLKNPSLFYQIPCGQCAECRKHKANDYMARSYAQYKDTLDNHGFSFFDTLTYNNQCVPNYKGLLCFNWAHIRNFLKRLRINIDRYWLRDMSQSKDKKTNDYPPLLDENGKKIFPFKGKVKGHLKYYIVSEYGGKTHRPHYHVIFFVTIDGMTVMLFRDLVANAWKYGFIDRRYSVHKRVINGIGACKYISEYVNKDIEFRKELDKKISELQISGIFINNHVLKRLKCSHRQSQGYGLAILWQNDREILERGVCRVPDSKYVHKEVALPMYIKRKLFMQCVPNDYAEYEPIYRYDKAGFRHVKDYGLVRKSHWEYTDYGKQWRINRQNDVIDNVARTYHETFSNFFYWLGFNHLDGYNTDYAFGLLKRFEIEVGWFQLACYVVCYRGRLLSHDSDIYETVLDDLDYKPSEQSYWLVDKKLCGKNYIGCKFNAENYPFIRLDNKGTFVYTNFCEYDSMPPYFNDKFEVILDILSKVQHFRNADLERTYIAKCEWRAKQKLLKNNS